MVKPISPAMVEMQGRFVALLRECVLLQEKGEAVGEMWARLFTISGVSTLAEAAHIERMRMIHEGMPGISIPQDGTGFIIGFAKKTPEENSTEP